MEERRLELNDPEPEPEAQTSYSMGANDIVDELQRTYAPLVSRGRGTQLEVPGALPAP